MFMKIFFILLVLERISPWKTSLERGQNDVSLLRDLINMIRDAGEYFRSNLTSASLRRIVRLEQQFFRIVASGNLSEAALSSVSKQALPVFESVDLFLRQASSKDRSLRRFRRKVSANLLKARVLANRGFLAYSAFEVSFQALKARQAE